MVRGDFCQTRALRSPHLRKASLKNNCAISAPTSVRAAMGGRVVRRFPAACRHRESAATRGYQYDHTLAKPNTTGSTLLENKNPNVEPRNPKRPHPLPLSRRKRGAGKRARKGKRETRRRRKRGEGGDAEKARRGEGESRRNALPGSYLGQSRPESAGCAKSNAKEGARTLQFF